MARVKAGMARQKGAFQEGHALDAKTATKILAKMVGRTLRRKRRRVAQANRSFIGSLEC
jgi:hypothetical protein